MEALGSLGEDGFPDNMSCGSDTVSEPCVSVHRVVVVLDNHVSYYLILGNF